MDPYQIWAYVATVLAAILAWLNTRKPQIYDLLIEILQAAKDDRITEEEFQRIVDRAIAVLGIDLSK